MRVFLSASSAEIDTTLFLADANVVDRATSMSGRWQCHRLPVKIIAGVVAINGNAELGNHRSREPCWNRPLEIRESGYTTAKRPSTRELHSPLSSALLSLRFITIPTSLLFLSFSLHCRLLFIVLFSVATLSPLNCPDNCVTALAFMRFFIAFHGRWSSPWWKGEQPTGTFNVAVLEILLRVTSHVHGLSFFSRSFPLCDFLFPIFGHFRPRRNS